MKAKITTKDGEKEINLILPDPYNQIPDGIILVEFVFLIKEDPVKISLIGTNPYTKDLEK